MNWRPIKTAPKDQHVLLRYPSLSDNGETYVNQGRWIEVPHTNVMFEHWKNKTPIPEAPHDGHWEIGYVAIMEHGGAWYGHTFEHSGCRVKPTHWMPLPKVPKS